jgi:hypothetical protein
MVDVEIRPNTDEDGVAGDGSYWEPEHSYKCNYELRPLGFLCPSAAKLSGE